MTMTPVSSPVGETLSDGREDLPTFLRWVAESYVAMAQASDSAEEIDALLGSAEMAREHIATLSRRSLGEAESGGEAVAFIDPSDLAKLRAGESIVFYAKDRDSIGIPLYASPARSAGRSSPAEPLQELGTVGRTLEKQLILFAEKVGPLYIEDIREFFNNLPPALQALQPKGE